MATVSQTMIKRSNSVSLYVPNQCIPFLCVFIIAKTPTVLLVSFVVGYIMLVQPKKKQFIVNPPEMKMIESTSTVPPALSNSLASKKDNSRNFSFSYSNEDDKGLHMSPLRILSQEEETLLLCSSDEEDENAPISPARNLLPVEDNNSSIEFENLMKFPSCPTTLPRLDTHFNFVVDHDIQSPDPSKINWSAIHQELEYEQQREEVVVNKKKPQQQQLEKPAPDAPQHPLLMLHQLQQDNLSMIFPDDELSSICSPRTPMFLGDAAILHVENDAPFLSYNQQPQQQQRDTIQIEDLLILPQPKQSNSSPGQLFKSKFQKAVSRMKKTSNIVSHKQESKSSKRSSVVSAGSTANSELPRFDSYQDSLFSTAISPRPSASARVHDHIKGRFNKMFKK